MKLTNEQFMILGAALANKGLIIATTADSPNDIVWVQLVEDGVLEVVDPEDTNADLAKIAPELDLRTYRATQLAIDCAAKLKLEAVQIEAFSINQPPKPVGAA